MPKNYKLDEVITALQGEAAENLFLQNKGDSDYAELDDFLSKNFAEISEQIDANKRFSENYTLIYFALRHGFPKFAKALVQAEVDLCVRTESGNVPFDSFEGRKESYASRQGYYDLGNMMRQKISQKLLDKGFDEGLLKRLVVRDLDTMPLSKTGRKALYVFDPMSMTGSKPDSLQLSRLSHYIVGGPDEIGSYSYYKRKFQDELKISESIVKFDDNKKAIVCYTPIKTLKGSAVEELFIHNVRNYLVHEYGVLKKTLQQAANNEDYRRWSEVQNFLAHEYLEEDFKGKVNSFFQAYPVGELNRVGSFDELVSSSFCVGEAHGDTSPKKFLIQNMQQLKKNGYDTFFMEFLFQDTAMQDLLDEYFSSSEEEMPHILESYLKAQNEGHMVGYTSDVSDSVEYNYLTLIKEAKKQGIRIVGLETVTSSMAGYTEFGARGVARYKGMNYEAQKIINEHLISGKAKKWFALMGNTHIANFEGVPGVAELMGVPAVDIYQIKENETEIAFGEARDVDGEQIRSSIRIAMSKDKDAPVLPVVRGIDEDFNTAAAGFCYRESEVTLNFEGGTQIKVTKSDDGSFGIEQVLLVDPVASDEELKTKVIEEFNKHKVATEAFAELLNAENAQKVLDVLGIYRRVIATESTDEEVRKTKARNDTASALADFPNLRNLLFQDEDSVTHEFKFKDGVDEKTLESLSIRLAGEFGISQKGVTATKVGARGFLPQNVLSGIKGRGPSTASAAAGNSSDSEESKTANFGHRVSNKRRASAGAMKPFDENEEEQQGESLTTSNTAVDQDLEEKKAQLAEAIAKLKEALAKVVGEDHEARMKKAIFYQSDIAGATEIRAINLAKKEGEPSVKAGDMRKEFRIIVEALCILGDVRQENFESFFRKFEDSFSLEDEVIEVVEKGITGKAKKNSDGTDKLKRITISKIAEKETHPAFFGQTLSEQEKQLLKLKPEFLANRALDQNLTVDTLLSLIDLKINEVKSTSGEKAGKANIDLLTKRKNELLKEHKIRDHRSSKADEVTKIREALDIDAITDSDFIEEDQKIIAGIRAALKSEDPIVQLFRIKKNLEALDALKIDALELKTKGSFYTLYSTKENYITNKASEKERLRGIVGNQDKRIEARMALDSIELIFRDLINPNLSADKSNLLAMLSQYEASRGVFDSPLGYKYQIEFSFRDSNPKYKSLFANHEETVKSPLRYDGEVLFKSLQKVQEEFVTANQLVLSSVLGVNFYSGVDSFSRSDYGILSQSVIRQDLVKIKTALIKAGHKEQVVSLEEALESFPDLTRESFFNQLSVVLLNAFAPDGKVETCLKNLRKNPDLVEVLQINTMILDRDETAGLINSVLDNPNYRAAKEVHQERVSAFEEKFVKFKNKFDRARLLEEVTVAEVSPIEMMEIYQQATTEAVLSLQDYFLHRKASLRKPGVGNKETESEFVFSSSSVAAKTVEEVNKKTLEEQLREIQEELKRSVTALENSSDYKYSSALEELYEKEAELASVKFKSLKFINEASRTIGLDIILLKKEPEKGTELTRKQVIGEILNKMSDVISDRCLVDLEEEIAKPLISFRDSKDGLILDPYLRDIRNIQRLKSEVRDLQVIRDNPTLSDELKSVAAQIEETRKSHTLFQVFCKNIDKLEELIKKNTGDEVALAKIKVVETRNKISRLVVGADIGVSEVSDFSSVKMSIIDRSFREKIASQEITLAKELEKMQLAIRAKIEEQEAGTSNPIRAAASAAAAAETTQQSESESFRELSQRNRELEDQVLKLKQEISGNKRVNQSSSLSKGSSRQQTASRPSNEIKIMAVRGYDEEKESSRTSNKENKKNVKSEFEKAAMTYYQGKDAKPSSICKPKGKSALADMKTFMEGYHSSMKPTRVR